MLMCKGVYGTERYLTETTVDRFTQMVLKDGSNRRGLGFDKPETDSTKASPCSPACSASTFGHTGFTGTAVWADPEKKFLFVFLSNRVHPDANNKKILEMSLRTNIQEQFYKALEQRTPVSVMPEGIY
jgi:CubicO group peptidase (beta-lactamase class C family)